MADKDGKVYMPAQHTRRGVAGYKGKNIVVVDADGKDPQTGKKVISTDRS